MLFGKKLVLLFVLSFLSLSLYAQKAVIFNGALGVGTFSAGEYDDGSVFLGGLISTEWILNNNGFSYGFESGFNGGKTGNNIILGIPIAFRFGWYPNFFKIKNMDIFLFGKIGWAFGIWGSSLEQDSAPNGIVAGFNFGGRYYFTQKSGLYTELGYNYFGLARNSNYPEYPLGYGSGKIYASLGLSYKI